MSPPEMLSLIQNLVSAALVTGGLVFTLAGAIGVLRLPEFYTRMHAAGVTDTLGAEMVLIGLAIQAGFTLLAAKILLVGLFLFLTSPTATHAIAYAAQKSGLDPLLKRFHPAPPGDKEKG